MFIQIKSEYLDYLRLHGDTRVPFQDYGEYKFKPFFRAFKLEGSNVYYVGNVGHYDPQGKSFIETLDYKKIMNSSNEQLAVIHLNTMFPVPEDEIIEYDYKMIEEKLSWGDSFDFSRHVARFWNYEGRINQPDVESSAKLIYEIRNKGYDHFSAKRTLNFRNHEAKMIEYKLNKEFEEKYLLFEVELNSDRFIIREESEGMTFVLGEVPDLSDLNCMVTRELRNKNNLDIRMK